MLKESLLIRRYVALLQKLTNTNITPIIYLAIHLNHGLAMAGVYLVTTVSTKSDPANKTLIIKSKHFPFI